MDFSILPEALEDEDWDVVGVVLFNWRVLGQKSS
jgi:hypothetical protein